MTCLVFEGGDVRDQRGGLNPGGLMGGPAAVRARLFFLELNLLHALLDNYSLFLVTARCFFWPCLTFLPSTRIPHFLVYTPPWWAVVRSDQEDGPRLQQRRVVLRNAAEPTQGGAARRMGSLWNDRLLSVDNANFFKDVRACSRNPLEVTLDFTFNAPSAWECLPCLWGGSQRTMTSQDIQQEGPKPITPVFLTSWQEMSQKIVQFLVFLPKV